MRSEEGGLPLQSTHFSMQPTIHLREAPLFQDTPPGRPPFHSATRRVSGHVLRRDIIEEPGFKVSGNDIGSRPLKQPGPGLSAPGSRQARPGPRLSAPGSRQIDRCVRPVCPSPNISWFNSARNRHVRSVCSSPNISWFNSARSRHVRPVCPSPNIS